MTRVVKRYRTKHVEVKLPNTAVQLCIRHASGRIDLALSAPLSISLAYAPPKRKRTK